MFFVSQATGMIQTQIKAKHLNRAPAPMQIQMVKQVKSKEDPEKRQQMLPTICYVCGRNIQWGTKHSVSYGVLWGCWERWGGHFLFHAIQYTLITPAYTWSYAWWSEMNLSLISLYNDLLTEIFSL